MADTQQFKKKKQKHDKNRKDVHFQAEDKIWNKVHSQNSAEKDFYGYIMLKPEDSLLSCLRNRVN